MGLIFRILMVVACVPIMGAPAHRALRWEDVPEALRARIASGPDAYAQFRDQAAAELSSRVAAGEDDTLVYYVLQSQAFTTRSPFDPSTLAREVAAADYKLPVLVRARIRDFLNSFPLPSQDERMIWWQKHLAPDHRTPEFLESAWRETMRQLNRWTSKDPAERQSGLERAGLSTDVHPHSAYALWRAVQEVRKSAPQQRVLRAVVVGPGHNLAPARGFAEDRPPTSPQPYLFLDALFQAKMVDPQFFELQTLDVNPRVLQALTEFARASVAKLYVPNPPSIPAMQEWFLNSGTGIGVVNTYERERGIVIRPNVASHFVAESLNLVLEHLVPSPEYDIAAALDVFPYLPEKQMVAALVNLDQMMGEGSWLIANDERPAFQAALNTLGYSMVWEPGDEKGFPSGFALWKRK